MARFDRIDVEVRDDAGDSLFRLEVLYREPSGRGKRDGKPYEGRSDVSKRSFHGAVRATRKCWVIRVLGHETDDLTIHGAAE